MGEGILAGGAILWLLFMIVLGIVWLCLPFIIIGTNNRLDKIIALLETQRMTSGVAGAVSAQQTPGAPAAKKLPANVPSDLSLVDDRYHFTCPFCRTHLSAGITSIGGNIECGKCHQKVLLQKA